MRPGEEPAVLPTRRRFIAAMAGATLMAAGCGPGGDGRRTGRSATTAPGTVRARRAPRLPGAPFTLGVASGDPLHDRVVLWTRLAPDPTRGDGAMPSEPVDVQWAVAADPDLRKVVTRGVATAEPGSVHSLHVDADGLEPATVYHYRFTVGGEHSPVGRTRTLPAPGDRASRLRLATVNCQRFETGYYAAHRHMATENLDLVLFFGDYVYEYAGGKPPRGRCRARDRHPRRLPAPLRLVQGRPRPAGLSRTLPVHGHVGRPRGRERLRGRHPRGRHRRGAGAGAQGGRLPGLLRAPSSTPRAAHRTGGQAPPGRRLRRPGPDLAARRAAVRRSSAVSRRARHGGLRSGRLPRADRRRRPPAPRTRAGGLVHPRDRARDVEWNLVGNPGPDRGRSTPPTGGRARYYLETWDGYPAARRRFLEKMRSIPNPVVLTGDYHAGFVNDVHLDPEDRGTPVVATELLAPPISSPLFGADVRPRNPQVRYMVAGHGYLVLTVERGRVTGEFKILDDVTDPRSGSGSVQLEHRGGAPRQAGHRLSRARRRPRGVGPRPPAVSPTRPTLGAGRRRAAGGGAGARRRCRASARRG